MKQDPRKAARAALEHHRARNDRARAPAANPMQRPLKSGDEAINATTHWRQSVEHGHGIAGARKRPPAALKPDAQVITPADVEVERAPTPRGRYEADPAAFGAGFSAAGVGVDVTTGRGWGR